MNDKQVENEDKERKPFRVRLPGFITNEEVGLGDALKRVISTVGIKPCGGCSGRAGALNRYLVFSNRNPKAAPGRL